MTPYIIGASAALVLLAVGAFVGFAQGLALGRREGAFMLAMVAGGRKPEAQPGVVIDPSEAN